jgi:muramoyltetrapeptide carboxypeptidase
LQEGDLVALVATSGALQPHRADAAVDVLTAWGLRPRLGTHAYGRHTYLSGTDDERLADLNAALRDEEVRAVLCLRGGYGVQRIIDRVDFRAFAADPKLVMGFSDITALHVALWCETGLPTVHGPNAIQFGRGADSLTVRAAHQALMTSDPVVLNPDDAEGTSRIRTAGRTEGVLLGGNVTMLATMAGTRHSLDLSDAILLLEGYTDEPYRIDRALVQLKRSGWLDGVKGIAIGQFSECVDDGGPSVEDVLEEQLASLGVPVLGGLPIGHADQQAAVGLGAPAILDADAGTLVVQAAGRP